jgi:SGNH hydrolase-like domain, acetyltransferase AlgX
MRLFRAFIFFAAIAAVGLGADTGLIRVSERQRQFSSELAAELQGLKKANAEVLVRPDGWLFFAGELRLLSVGKFWGAEARQVAATHNPDEADPTPAIVDFCNELKRRGIGLLLVPVPPKAAIYPDKVLPNFDLHGENAAPYLTRFYDELRGNGIEVLDLTPLFWQQRESDRGHVFCKTDTHWSGNGCVLAAHAMAEKVKLSGPSRHDYATNWKQIEMTGDMVTLLPHGAQKPGPETIFVREVGERANGRPVQPDPDSPILLMGDSHTLVYHDFVAQAAGLLDQLADELGFPPDLIGTRGSGATAVRVDLYRRSRKNPGYLAKKKMIIWCFSAREFTEADAWARIPVSK